MRKENHQQLIQTCSRAFHLSGLWEISNVQHMCLKTYGARRRVVHPAASGTSEVTMLTSIGGRRLDEMHPWLGRIRQAADGPWD